MSETRPWVSGVVLAAGRSVRFGDGGPKQLLLWEGQPLVRRIVERALGSTLDEVVVVLGHASDRVEAAVGARTVGGRTARIVRNPRFAEGQSTSVRAGIEALDPRTAAAMFLPCDQPWLERTDLDRLRNGWETHGGIVVPTAGGRDGAPVTFARRYFGELAMLRGDVGGRRLVRTHAAAVTRVALPDPRALADIDRPEDVSPADPSAGR